MLEEKRTNVLYSIHDPSLDTLLSLMEMEGTKILHVYNSSISLLCFGDPQEIPSKDVSITMYEGIEDYLNRFENLSRPPLKEISIHNTNIV